MKQAQFVILLLMVQAVTCLASSEAGPSDVRISPGTVGYALTCFQGVEPERFPVKIVGILWNSSPGSYAIIGEASGEKVLHTGIMQGMSGSPVYMGDILIGAMAYAFPFAKTPLVGITPIHDMQRLWDSSSGRFPSSMNQVSGMNRFLHDPAAPLRSAMSPIGVALSCSGVSPHMLAVAGDSGILGSFSPVTGGVRDSGAPGIEIVPGSAGGIALITGDISMAGMGTITSVDGDRVLAFGHPMFHAGDCSLPMITGEVVASVPNLNTSFKIFNAGELAGRIIRDGASGIAGILHQSVEMIPVSVTVTEAPERTHRFHLNVIDEPQLSGVFTAFGAASILDYLGPNSGDISYRIETEVRLKDLPSLHWRRITGMALNPYLEMFNAMAPLSLLGENPVQGITPEGIDIAIHVEELLQLATLENARVLDRDVAPGCPVRVQLTVKGHRSQSTTRDVAIPVPADLQPGEYILAVMDAASYNSFRVSLQLPIFRYRNMESYLEVLQDMGAEDEFHILIYRNGQEGVVRDRILPDVPPTLASVLGLPGTDAGIRGTPVIAAHEIVRFPWQVFGSRQESLRVSPEFTPNRQPGGYSAE